MGSCALIGFGNTERTFRDGLMVVKEDNGVDAEIRLFILQVFTLIWSPSVNNPIRRVKMWWGGRRETATGGKVPLQTISGIYFRCWFVWYVELHWHEIRSCNNILFWRWAEYQLFSDHIYHSSAHRQSFWKCQKPVFYSLASRDHQQQFQKRLKTTGCPHQKEAQNSYIMVHNVFFKVLVSILV